MTTAPAGAGSGGLTAEERLLRDTAREFAQREIAPTAIERSLMQRKKRPSWPTRSCRWKTGQGEVSLISEARKTISGIA